MRNTLSALNLKRGYSRTEKIEFGLSTFIFLMGILIIFTEEPTEEGSIGNLYYVYDILVISSFYISFLLLNFIVIPNLKRKDLIWVNSAILAGVIGISFIIFPHLEFNALLLTLGIYFLLKFGIIFSWKRIRAFREEKGSFSTGILLAGIFYLLFMFLMVIGEADFAAIVIPGILIPFSIALYALSFYKLIPTVIGRKRPFLRYFSQVFLVLLLAAIPIGLIAYLLTGDEEISAATAFFNLPTQFFLTVPIAWLTYKRYRRGREEVQNLQKELGQSTAKFDFLRSQINPHFLFNALNTLYGTAIQENAERTGEGIQQLGDMMRFMLHENMQEKISLEREIEYLEHYVHLQRLRTDVNPDIVIQTDIEKHFDYVQISPMLLIPFVENAFKHGISFREASHIKIALEKKGNTLYFDVYNSKHPKQQSDPEKDKSGIGLSNVEQRLQLLYPQKHELLIRENSKEFFVHLSLQLS